MRGWDWKEETSHREGSADLGDVEFGNLSRMNGNKEGSSGRGEERCRKAGKAQLDWAAHLCVRKGARCQGIPAL